MKIEPQGNRVLVRLEGYDLDRDGIQLVEWHKEVLQNGIVEAVGLGAKYREGIRKPEVSVGDRVVVSQRGGTRIKDGDKVYMLISDDKIEGVVDEHSE